RASAIVGLKDSRKRRGSQDVVPVTGGRAVRLEHVAIRQLRNRLCKALTGFIAVCGSDNNGATGQGEDVRPNEFRLVLIQAASEAPVARRGFWEERGVGEHVDEGLGEHDLAIALEIIRPA